MRERERAKRQERQRQTDTHTHTHTVRHTARQRERKRACVRESGALGVPRVSKIAPFHALWTCIATKLMCELCANKYSHVVLSDHVCEGSCVHTTTKIKCFLSKLRRSCYVAHMNESCHTFERVISHKSWRTFKRVMSHMQISL